MELITILSRLNRWWRTGSINSQLLYKTVRSEFEDIMASLAMERILSIVGPRRVGKSTLMNQTIHHLLENGSDPKRILFISGDDPALFNKERTIGDILETYANEVLHENVGELQGRIYVFIDEIHMIQDWQLWLKRYYDRKYPIKFIVSGSSSTHLFMGSRESLLGRMDSVQIMPLTFIQFCKFWAVYKQDERIEEFLNTLPQGSVFTGLEDYYISLKQVQWKMDAYKPYVNRVLQEYLLIGGYPEYFMHMDPVLWQKRLIGDIIGQGLYRDIVRIYPIKSPERLEKLLYFITANNGQDFSFKTISDTIGCDNETVSNYLSYLSQAYLAIALDNFSTNVGKVIRKNKALYVLDNGIGNALLHIDAIDHTRAGHLIEALCVRDALASCEVNYWKLFYWRDGKQEIDLVIHKKTELLPVEVKYRSDPYQVENMKAFIQTSNRGTVSVQEGLFVTKYELSKLDNDPIYFVPFWLMK